MIKKLCTILLAAVLAVPAWAQLEGGKSKDGVVFGPQKGQWQISMVLGGSNSFYNENTGSYLLPQFNNFGGSNTVESTTSNQRSMGVTDYVTVQVVQLLPNGNLMVQGKKTILNGTERVDFLVSGVVDPRWIDQNGQVSSRNVANLQFALAGKGSVTRAGNEGFINRAVRYLF